MTERDALAILNAAARDGRCSHLAAAIETVLESHVAERRVWARLEGELHRALKRIEHLERATRSED